MSEPFISEIRMMSFNFAPKGWAQCDGQILPINQNQALFSLLGTTYGGDGRQTFALPDLRGRVPMHMGSGHTLGERGGEQTHTLSISETPAHTHTFVATSSDGNIAAPGSANTANMLAGVSNAYGPAQDLTSLAPQQITNTGGSQPHLNMQPFLTLNFCIALQGIFPSPN